MLLVHFVYKPLLKTKVNGTLFSPKEQPVHIELGCGKGGFAAAATTHPEVNYIAMDIKPEMLGLAKRKLEKAYECAALPTNNNIRILIQNIEQLDTSFGEGDKIERIYINFCNPWPRKKHKKRRLTHPRQLIKYKDILTSDGAIYFKTDDDELFEESVEYFNETGFVITYITRDLHAENIKENIVTEHEKMFTEEGKKIKFLIAKRV